MEILGVGPSELIFIVIIALIILGPKDMQKAGRTLGKWMRDIVTSDSWKIFQQTSQELRTLPTRLMREANTDLNQVGKEINNAINPDPRKEGVPSSWMTKPNLPPRSQPTPTTIPTPENKIVPPDSVETKTNESDPETDA
jgi:sec-independent protein translocase protein TatB